MNIYLFSKSCLLHVNPVPSNYHGTLTFGKLRGISSPTEVLIEFYKNCIENPHVLEGTTAADGTISVSIPNPLPFFSEYTQDYQVFFFQRTGLGLLKIIDPDASSDPALDKEAIRISFSREICENGVLPQDITLTKFNGCNTC